MTTFYLHEKKLGNRDVIFIVLDVSYHGKIENIFFEVRCSWCGGHVLRRHVRLLVQIMSGDILPQEILIEVFGYLNAADIARCCRVCTVGLAFVICLFREYEFEVHYIFHSKHTKFLVLWHITKCAVESVSYLQFMMLWSNLCMKPMNREFLCRCENRKLLFTACFCFFCFSGKEWKTWIFVPMWKLQVAIYCLLFFQVKSGKRGFGLHREYGRVFCSGIHRCLQGWLMASCNGIWSNQNASESWIWKDAHRSHPTHQQPSKISRTCWELISLGIAKWRMFVGQRICARHARTMLKEILQVIVQWGTTVKGSFKQNPWPLRSRKLPRTSKTVKSQVIVCVFGIMCIVCFKSWPCVRQYSGRLHSMCTLLYRSVN